MTEHPPNFDANPTRIPPVALPAATPASAPVPSSGPLLGWYENRRPAVRALILFGATTALNLFAPWALPFLRPLVSEPVPPAMVQPK